MNGKMGEVKARVGGKGRAGRRISPGLNFHQSVTYVVTRKDNAVDVKLCNPSYMIVPLQVSQCLSSWEGKRWRSRWFEV